MIEGNKIPLKEAVARIRAGEVVVVPTDTVYGLVSRFDISAKIGQLKSRLDPKPLLILAASLDQVKELIDELPPRFEEIARKVWPGPVSIVVPTSLVSKEMRAGLPSAGFRIPDHPLLLELLKQTGPLASSSANVTDQPPACSAEEVRLDLPILDGGPCKYGEPSAIIEYDGDWKVIRGRRQKIEELEIW